MHEPQAEHVEHADLYEPVRSGQDEVAFDEAFGLGDELFETTFSALDGVGANVGDGQRFHRLPRADLAGPGASHFPGAHHRTQRPGLQRVPQPPLRRRRRAPPPTWCGLYGDLRRHDMGHGMAEPIHDGGIQDSVWMTKELWGAGNTAPYLHDGRATTLTEAILEHGGEAGREREAFSSLSPDHQADLVAFLESLVLFKMDGEEG